MYILNILLTISFSMVNIIGSIITGKVPKGSMWQLIRGNVELMSNDYWYDKDVAYQWRSSDDVQKDLNWFRLEKRINNVCESEKLNDLTKNEKLNLAETIKEIVVNYNRTPL